MHDDRSPRRVSAAGARPLPAGGLSPALLLTACLLLIAFGPAAAQKQFRITHHRDPDEPSSIVLVGTVFNDDSRDVVDVWLTAEALDAGGKVVATGIVFVSSLIPARASTPLVVKLPRVEGAREFHLAVTRFRYRSVVESP